MGGDAYWDFNRGGSHCTVQEKVSKYGGKVGKGMGMGMGVGIGKAKKEERGGRMSKINLGLMLEEWEIIIKALEIYSSVAYEFQQEYNAQWAHELCRELHNKLWEVEEYRKKFGNSPFDDVEGKPIEIDEEDMPF